MAMFKLVLLTSLAASLAAQEGSQGFTWVGLQAGSISFDPEEKVGSGAFVGGQIGRVPGPGRYGYSLQLQVAHPKSDLVPGVSPNHRELSATFLNGLGGDASSRFWPYFGIGLGVLTYPSYSATALTHETRTAGAGHTSFGLLHRPGAFIWGAEWRHRIAFTKRDMSESQFSIMAGFSWGGRAAAPRVEASAPAPAPVPPAPEPTPVVPPKAPEVKPAPMPAPQPLPVVDPKPTEPAPALTPVVIAPSVPPQPVPPPPTAPVPQPPTPAPVPAQIPAPVPPAPVPTEVRGDSTLATRLEVLRQGQIAKAIDLGRARMQAIPAGHWTLRLEIANLPATLKSAVDAFGAGKPDLFVAPIKLRGGKTAYQLFLGSYPSKADAERAVSGVPMFFREGGQKPLPILGREIPTQVNR